MEITYWNKDIETMDSSAIESMQLERLQKLIGQSLQTDFYKKRLAKAGITSGEDIKSMDDLKRLPKAKRIFGGWFNSKIFLYKLRSKSRPMDGEYSVTLNDAINLLLVLRSEFIKDQYGESPNKDEYIAAALAPIRRTIASGKKLSAVFVIDGGPRGDILDAIFELEDENSNFFPTIFLCDANRSIYTGSIGCRPDGKFLKGSNKTLNGERLYKDQYSGSKAKFFYNADKVTLSRLLEKEVWFYQRKVK